MQASTPQSETSRNEPSDLSRNPNPRYAGLTKCLSEISIQRQGTKVGITGKGRRIETESDRVTLRDAIDTAAQLGERR